MGEKIAIKTGTKLIGFLIAVVLLLLYPAALSAQTIGESISAGTAWLLEKRYGMNIWAFTTPPDPEQTEFSVEDYTRTYLRDTFASTLTLQKLQINALEYAPTIDWTEYALPQTTEFIAQKILILNKAGREVSEPLKLLIDNLKPDGGFAGGKKYPSNNLDTALSLQALKAINYPDQNVISYALGYLIDTQNSDGGWGFYQGDDSNVYMTAMGSMTLQQFSQTPTLATAINKATSYLIAHQNADGGFGSSSSTVYETALSYIALLGVTTDNTVLGNAINYLINTQMPNGSWFQDPYSTALALRALYLSENKPTPPPPPTTGTVTGKVVDASTNQPLSGVSVVLQADPSINTVTDATGSFTLSNIPPGSQKINFSLSGYTTATATVNITAGSIINLGTIPLSTNPTTGIIKGTVVDSANGQQLSDVTITVTGSFTGNTITGPDGSFIFTNVTPGTVTITASKAGYYSVTGTGTVVAGGILFFNPQLSTSPPTATTGNLTGKVFDGSTNTPIQGATVSISGVPSTTTDAQGSFLIKDITLGTYQVAISASGYISQAYQVMILAGVTTDIQTIYLTPSVQTTTITGKVTDAETGKPITGAEVLVIGTNLSVKTDATGTYTITGINLLEFSVKASAVGYDSLTYSIKTPDYGIYTVDFSFEPSFVSTVNIISLTTDKESYPANDLVTIIATLENTGDAAFEVTVNAQIADHYGNILALVSHDEGPPLLLNPKITETVSLPWGTGKNLPGTYTIYLTVIDPLSGNLLAEGSTAFTIEPTVLIGDVKPLITPRYSYVKATETISLSIYLSNMSNVDITLTAEYGFKDPDGNVINNGSINFTVASSEFFKIIELVSFSYTFMQSGQYPVEMAILSGSNRLSSGIDAIHVAPSVRIEPTKTVNPSTVIPDGDKTIRIEIQIKGVEDKP